MALDSIQTFISELTRKPIQFRNRLDGLQIKTLTWWVSAFQGLKNYPFLWDLFQKACVGIIFGLPKTSEDAQWRSDKWMFLALRDSGFSAQQMLRGIVHELGHAYEEQLFPDGSIDKPFGEPPQTTNYASTNTGEDFAESFMLYWLEPDLLQQIAPSKFAFFEDHLR